ncbi:DUF6318 family protein [Georgenia yuyongxinii]
MALGEGRRRVTALAAAVVAAAMVLTACSARADPEVPSTPSRSATTSAEPSESADPTLAEVEKPIPLDAMRRDDLAGAEAAAQYFLELYPYVFATGELDQWAAMSHPECVFCASSSQSAQVLHDEGGRQAGGELVFTYVESRAPVDENDYFVVWLDAEERALVRVGADGQILESHNGLFVEFDVVLLRSEDRWLVRGVTVRSTEIDGG